MRKDSTSVMVMVPREERSNVNRLWTQKEDVAGRAWFQEQGAYMSQDVILVERLPQGLCEPFGYIELQGFTDLHPPLGQKENCGVKEKHTISRRQQTSHIIHEPSAPPQPPSTPCRF